MPAENGVPHIREHDDASPVSGGEDRPSYRLSPDGLERFSIDILESGRSTQVIECATGTLADRLRKQVPGLVKEVSPRDSQTPKLFSTDSVNLQLGAIAEKSNAVIAKSPSGSKSRMAKNDVLPREPASGESMTESFSEDFRSAADKELPDGWVNLDEQQLLLVRQDFGRPHLRTKPAAYEWDEQGVLGEERPSKVRLPPVSIEGDFQIELTVLSNETWSNPRSMALTLKGQDNETLTLRCFEDSSGFVAVLPGAEESKPFSLSGKTPYRLRLERKEGVYRVVNNSKTLLTLEANDDQEFHVVELELSPYCEWQVRWSSAEWAGLLRAVLLVSSRAEDPFDSSLERSVF